MGLIMAFLALGTADILDCNTILRAVFQIVMEFLVNAVEFITVVPGRIREIYLGRTVTVDTPAHAKLSELLHLVHFLDRTMTGLALHFAGAGVLHMAKEHMVGEIVDLHPLDRLGILRIVPARFGIVTGIAV